MIQETRQPHKRMNVTRPIVALIGAMMVAPPIVAETKTPIDQIPMYGGMDRNSVPRLKEGDEKFIADVTKVFGGREAAAQAWIERGFRLYNQNDYKKAMQRFNQAWLLDPNNPDVFFGFGVVLHDKGQNCEAKDMLGKARNMGMEDAGFLADLGRVYTLCAVEEKSGDEKTTLLQESISLYQEALRKAPHDRARAYVYSSFSSAYFWRENYPKAWEMVHKAESLGGGVPKKFRKMLKKKMKEPK